MTIHGIDHLGSFTLRQDLRLFLAGLAALALLSPAGVANAGGPGNLKFDESSFEVIEEAGLATIFASARRARTAR